MTESKRPTTGGKSENLLTEHQKSGDARRPSDTLDQDQGEGETVPRRSSLTEDK